MPKRQPDDTDPTLGSVDPEQNPPIAFPDAYWEWFVGRCAAHGIADPTKHRIALEALFGHLVSVNRWLNLTTLVSPRDYLKFHVLDSLMSESDSRLRHLSEGSTCVDLGSGGGYPGLPLALWHPQIPWVLADARKKKVEFLAAAAAMAQAKFGVRKITALHLRGSEVGRSAPDLQRNCQLVVCRAMGQAVEVLKESSMLLRKSGHLIIYKGPSFAGDEKAASLKACDDLGFRFIGEKRVKLEDEDPERVMAVFQRIS
jgi:16S rRNA (guanine527-N7)-methyltransferase